MPYLDFGLDSRQYQILTTRIGSESAAEDTSRPRRPASISLVITYGKRMSHLMEKSRHKTYQHRRRWANDRSPDPNGEPGKRRSEP